MSWNSQHWHHNAARNGAGARPTRHDEVESEHGEEGGVAELVVSSSREEETQRVLTLHVEQARNCQVSTNTFERVDK